MQMGMLGNSTSGRRMTNAAMLALGAARPIGTPFAGFAYDERGRLHRYDVTSHPGRRLRLALPRVAHRSQPLPFAAMDDNYPMFNGRGYRTPPSRDLSPRPVDNDNAPSVWGRPRTFRVDTATAGQKILLRMSSLSTTSSTP